MQKGLRGDYFRSVRIHLISTPRNVSTALMYSFAQRADTRVVDEPFYAYYLEQSGADHPARAETLASMPADLPGVYRWLDGLDDRPVLFLKGMAHHLDGVPVKDLAAWKSLFFLRDPKQLIASFAQVIPHPTMRDIGSAAMVRLYEAIGEAGGEVHVLDSAQLVADPEGTLRAVCDRLGIPFDPPCSPGRRVRVPRTACGPRTGTPTCTGAPASAGRPPATGRFPTTAVRYTRKPCRTTKPSSATPSSPDPCSRSSIRAMPTSRCT
ncbi:MAG: hypothetical protein R2810_03945 [Flavobacteriales bacterium]